MFGILVAANASSAPQCSSTPIYSARIAEAPGGGAGRGVTMEFGEKMTVMRCFRKMTSKRLCELAGMIGPTLALVADGTIVPVPVLEKKIRIALGWPVEVDAMLEMIRRATYKSGEGNSEHQ